MYRLVFALFACIAVALPAPADTLVCTDGRRLTGEVTLTEDVYIVKSRGIQTKVPAAEVREWIRDPAGASGPAVPSSRPVASSPRPAPPAPPAPVDPARRSEALSAWLRQAQDSLGAGEFLDARAKAMDVLDVDPENVRAWHAVALSHVGTKELTKAAAAIEKAMEKAKAQRRVDRPLVLNFGMILISARNPMRAARFLMDHLKEHEKQRVDETVLNALAVALTNADHNARRSPLYAQAGRAYDEFNRKLESTRTDKRRWGIEWLPEAEAKRKIETWERQEAALDKVRQRMFDASAELTAARRHQAKIKSQSMIGGVNRGMVNAAQQRVDTAQRNYNAAREQYRKQDALVQRPKFPTAMATVAMDDERGTADDTEPFTPTPAQVATASESSRARRTAARRTQPKPPTTPAGDPEDEAEKETPAAPELFVKRASAAGRTVVRSAGAFAVAPDLVVTAAAAVAGAKEITLTGMTGGTFKAQLLRANDDSGLALLRITGQRQPAHLPLAGAFRGGAVQCVSIVPGLFELRAEQIPGSMKLAAGAASLTLAREPRRPGTPLLVNNQVVAVQLADRGMGHDNIPVATLDDLRALCGADLPTASAPAAATPAPDPAHCLFELAAVCAIR